MDLLDGVDKDNVKSNWLIFLVGTDQPNSYCVYGSPTLSPPVKAFVRSDQYKKNPMIFNVPFFWHMHKDR